MKKLLLSVSCVCDEFSERAESFYIELDDSLKERITKLAQAVSDLGVFALEEFNYQGKWSDLFICSTDIEDHSDNFDELVALLKEEEARIYVPMLRVMEDYFYFIALPKYCNDDVALSTARVKIKCLENDDLHIDLD